VATDMARTAKTFKPPKSDALRMLADWMNVD
jgi:hypothetical protein